MRERLFWEHLGKGRLGWDKMVFSRKVFGVGKRALEGTSGTPELCPARPSPIHSSSLRP